MRRPGVVTLITDFGTADGYVGAMKGVILSIAPEVRLVDISHQIAAHSVREAAFVLYSAYSYFPSHTVHVAVVDPGVGPDRRAIAVRTARGTFVGPDNGIFTYVMSREEVQQVVEIAEPAFRLEQVSGTFHGRDVFAPAAAHLAAGTPVGALGAPVADPLLLALPLLEIGPGYIGGEVLHVDRFGNAVTSIGRLEWRGEELELEPAFGQDGGPGGMIFPARAAVTSARGREIATICRSYAQAEVGRVLALVGSGGHLEIALREGNAARELGLEAGALVAVRWS